MSFPVGSIVNIPVTPYTIPTNTTGSTTINTNTTTSSAVPVGTWLLTGYFFYGNPDNLIFSKMCICEIKQSTTTICKVGTGNAYNAQFGYFSGALSGYIVSDGTKQITITHGGLQTNGGAASCQTTLILVKVA